MTQEDKELLLKDLCTRLPYGVKIRISSESNGHLHVDIDTLDIYYLHKYMLDGGYYSNRNFYKTPGFELHPYLFPISSMIDKDLVEFLQIKGMNLNTDELKTFRRRETAIVSTLPSYSRHIDWLNKNHFDYRGLIDKGLAIDATGKGIY